MAETVSLYLLGPFLVVPRKKSKECFEARRSKINMASRRRHSTFQKLKGQGTEGMYAWVPADSPIFVVNFIIQGMRFVG